MDDLEPSMLYYFGFQFKSGFGLWSKKGAECKYNVMDFGGVAAFVPGQLLLPLLQ
jgi:hypothetical protein